MNSKSRELIHMMLKIQDKLCLMYKNVSVIEGQYDVTLKSASKVLSELMKKRTDYYRTVVIEAADGSDEITDEGYSQMKVAITSIKDELSQQNFSSVDDFIAYAILHTNQFVSILKMAKSKLENLDNVDQPLYKMLSQVEHMEEETVIVLNSFVRNTEAIGQEAHIQ